MRALFRTECGSADAEAVVRSVEFMEMHPDQYILLCRGDMFLSMKHRPKKNLKSF
jgi:hypothetical protein